MHLWIAVLITVFASGSVGAQTPLGLPVEGVQTIRLTDRAGKNQIQFVSTAPMEEIHGTASGISGVLTLDPDNIEAMTGRIEAPVARMETGIKLRDEHLRSKDWLHESAFPLIVFEVKGIEDVQVQAEAGRAVIRGTAVGDFSLHGVTQTLSLPFEATYIQESEQTRKRISGDLFAIQGTFQIALKDFEIQGARGMVGSRVGAVINLKANFFGATEAAGERE